MLCSEGHRSMYLDDPNAEREREISFRAPLLPLEPAHP
jgi:hypothetical protein